MQALPNYIYKAIRTLNSKKGRQENGTFIIEGEKGVNEAIKANWPIKRLIISSDLTSKYSYISKTVKENLTYKELTIFFASKSQIEGISDLTTSPGIIAEAKMKPEEISLSTKETSLVLACFDINDPGNMGTIIRTADWYDVKTIVISKNTTDPFSPKVVRSSMGSLFHVNILESNDFIESLKSIKKEGFTLIASTLTGKSQKISKSKSACLILGSESHGLSEEIIKLADIEYTIPRFGEAESLNVGVSCGIILNELSK